MADNFDMKKFLVENQTGPYAKAKLTEGEAAYEYEKGKAAGEKEEKEKLKEYEVIYVYGEDGKCYRKDDEGNYDQVDRSYCQRYAGSGVREEKEKVEETVDNRTLMTVEKIQDLLAKLKSNTATNSNIPTTDKQGLLDAFSYIEELLEDVGADIEIEMDDRYNKALEENAIRDSFLSPEAIDRMDGLVPQTALKALIGGAQAIIRDFKQEGFEDEEIFEFIMLKIKTLE